VLILDKDMLIGDLGSNINNFNSESDFSLSSDNPEQAILYFQQSFTKIFENFLSTKDNDSTDMFNTNDSFSNTNSFDPLSAGYDYFSQLVNLHNQRIGTNTSDNSLELLNNSASLIDKEAIYLLQGKKIVGTIQGVVNNNGEIFFRIDGELIAFDSLLEIRKGTIDV
jgi:hypothetical protein